MDKRKIVFYPHGGSGNHGCEALVRVLTGLFDKEIVCLYSSDSQQDVAYGIDQLCEIRSYQGNVRRWSKEHLRLMFRHYVLKDSNAYEVMPYFQMVHGIGRNDVAVSFGGDNYCYAGMVYQLKIIDKELDRRRINRVLWGCSIEDVRGIEEDLKGFRLIAARESLSYEMIKAINPNTMLFPDPAFVLPKKKCADISLENPSGYVGINLSPLVIECEKEKDIVLKNFVSLIQTILRDTTMDVLLIPHVEWEASSDLAALEKLKSFFPSERVKLCPNHNCMMQKWVISNCRFMVAARTHASIAAYSSCVPTLVIGYSIKAKGIAMDLFGTWEHFVLPAQSLQEEDELQKAFSWLLDNEEKIHMQYKQIMPEYLQRCKDGLKEFSKMIMELSYVKN